MKYFPSALFFVLLLHHNYKARCQQGQVDAASAFNEAASSSIEQQSIVDSLLGPSQTESDKNATNFGNTTQSLQFSGNAISGFEQQSPSDSTGAINLSCSLGYITPFFQGAFIGVGPSFYSKGFSCGKCIRISCDDASCIAVGNQAIALVVDSCGECNDSDVIISPQLFTKLAGRPPNPPNLVASWEFIDCSPYIDYNSTIKMLVKPGGSAYYQAFNFANSRQVITAVQVNGQKLKHETNNFWSWNPTGNPITPTGNFNFALLGENREVLRARITQLRSQDLKVQFNATSANTTTSQNITDPPTVVVPPPLPVNNNITTTSMLKPNETTAG